MLWWRQRPGIAQGVDQAQARGAILKLRPDPADVIGTMTKAGLLLLALLCACSTSRDVDTGPASAVFARFQSALFAGDRAALRRVVTAASRVTVADLPLQNVVGKQPLVVSGIEPRDSGFVVRVTDPNDGHRQSRFVIVREDGELLIDLVESGERQRVPTRGPRFHWRPEQTAAHPR